MDLTNLSTEELKLKLACTNFEIDMTTRIIKRHQDVKQEYFNKQLEYISEIDRREIEAIIDADFDVQLDYFLGAYDMNRSNKHIKVCEKFFDMLSVKVNRNKTIRFKAHPDFIKANFDMILVYLPKMFMYCCERDIMETKYHTISIENNAAVERINYYPETNTYYTDGRYIRGHKTLESVLNHMMEV